MRRTGQRIVGVLYPQQLLVPGRGVFGHRTPQPLLQLLVQLLWTGGGVLTRDGRRSPGACRKPLQNQEVNWDPQPDILSLGSPCNLNTCKRTSSAISLTDGSLGRGTKCDILENLSTTVRIVVLPSDKGRAVTKSKDMSDQSRNRQRKDKTHGRLMGRFVPGTDRTGVYIFFDVPLHSWPSKPLLHGKQSPFDTRITEKARGVGPVHNLGTEMRGNKKTVYRAASQNW